MPTRLGRTLASSLPLLLALHDPPQVRPIEFLSIRYTPLNIREEARLTFTLRDSAHVVVVQRDPTGHYSLLDPEGDAPPLPNGRHTLLIPRYRAFPGYPVFPLGWWRTCFEWTAIRNGVPTRAWSDRCVARPPRVPEALAVRGVSASTLARGVLDHQVYVIVLGRRPDQGQLAAAVQHLHDEDTPETLVDRLLLELGLPLDPTGWAMAHIALIE